MKNWESVQVMNKKVVVLDDDPTGTQTVHGIPVLTTWGVAELERELRSDVPCFYILTNTRAFPLELAKTINTQIGQNLWEASRRTQKDFITVSRSDSTLRGHFPGEVDALAEALGTDFDAWLIIPFFEAGGRVTIRDIHYLKVGEKLIPAGETEFARDHTFGFHSSNLREWVEEKMQGRIKANKVKSLSLETIRAGRTLEELLSWPKGCMGIVNLEHNDDLGIFVRGLNYAEEQGKRYLYRTAASFVAAKAGILPKPLLAKNDLQFSNTHGALIVVGSYVQKTSEQLAQLLQVTGVKGLEVKLEALLNTNSRQEEIARIASQADGYLRNGIDPVVYTSRTLVTGQDATASLAIGKQVSESLVTIVQSLVVRPRYLIAKGGITSSDIATQGLGVKRAMIEGQILPGVPVWRLGEESRFPDLCYIVFPGNVGTQESLANVVQALQNS
jgi:uncharacterized protein YgbK (DUF1537 family)